MTQTPESLKRILGHCGNKPISQILDDVSGVFGVSVADMIGHGRKSEFMPARRAAMYLSRQEGHTYSAIGRAMNRHHTTVMDGVFEVGIAASSAVTT